MNNTENLRRNESAEVLLCRKNHLLLYFGKLPINMGYKNIKNIQIYIDFILNI